MKEKTMEHHVFFTTTRSNEHGQPAILLQKSADGRVSFWGGPLNEGEDTHAAATRMAEAGWGLEGFDFWQFTHKLARPFADGHRHTVLQAPLADLQAAGWKAENVRQGEAIFLTYDELWALFMKELVPEVTMEVAHEMKAVLFS